MAFANLFLRLATVDEDVRTPDQSDFTCRNQTGNGSRGRKRKKQGEQPGTYNKKRCYLSQTCDAFKDCNAKAKQHQQQGAGGRRKPAGNTKQMMQDHDYKAGNDSSRCRKNQKFKTSNNRQVYNKQQKQGKKINKNQQQRNSGGRSEKGGGQVKRFMTQEFKDQNAILVDGRLLCRHFIFGRCVKADECQLEHVQAYNDLIKAACKFYIQGFCTKGAACPYMHKSFPCKYFHRKGRCLQKEDCKFSHEPLNEVTQRLLDEVLKRDKELCELRKTDEQEASAQTATAEDSEFIDVNGEPDAPKQPLRPQFYNSTGAEETTSVFQNEEPTCASDSAEPQEPPSTSSDLQEPVCYSVEAVLGPQLSRPFHSFFSAPGSQGSTSVSVSQGSSEVTESSTNQSEAPYSVDAVLRSYKSVAQSASYIPAYPPGKITGPSLGSENQNRKVSLNIKDEVNMHQGSSPPGVCTGLISETSPDFSYSSGDHQNQGGDTSERQKPAQVTSVEVKLELSGSLVTGAEEGDGEESMRHTCSPEDHAQLRTHLSSLTSDPESSRKLFSPSLGFKEFTGRTAAPVEPVTSSACHFGARQLAVMHPNNKRTQFTPKPGKLTDCTRKKLLYCQSQISDGDDSSIGCNKTQQRPSTSLFASGSMMPPAHPQDSMKSPQSADIATNKTSGTSFLSLCPAPLSESAPCLKSGTAAPCSPRSAEETVLHPKQRASYLSSPPPCQVGNDVKPKCERPASPELASDPENDRPTTGLRQQQLPDVSPPRDSAAETSTKSVLRTLFVSLRPYQEDGDKQNSRQRIVHPDEDMKAKSSLECVYLTQEQKSKRKRWKKKTTQASNQLSASKAADSAEQQPSSQTPQSSSEAAGVLSIRGAGTTKPLTGNPGALTSPFKPGAPLTQHPARLSVKRRSEEGDCAVGSVAGSFKDLFKTLDTI